MFYMLYTICNITGDQHIITTLFSEQTKAAFSLPIPLNDINVITVGIPASFQSMRENNTMYNVEVKKEDQDLIKIDWYQE